MIESSWKWASSRNLVRKKQVHGEDEAKLVLAETFGSLNENGDMMEWTGEAECEDMGWYKYMFLGYQSHGHIKFYFLVDS